MMALRAAGYWRSMLSRLGGNRPFATSTTPKVKQFAQSAGSQAKESYKKFALTGEFAPIYIVLGMLVVALSIGTHTAKQQLVHNPNVSLSKKKRGSISEADEPDRAVSMSDKFLNKSFLRKVAHIQDKEQNLPETNPRNAETLKAAGVNPRHS